MKKAQLNLSIFGFICFLSSLITSTGFSQIKQGYPEWPLILRHHSNVAYNTTLPQVQVANQIVNWRPNFLTGTPMPAAINNISNQASFNVGPSGAGFDICGNMIFYVGHTGLYADEGTVPSPLQLKIFLANGIELTNANNRLNCSPRDNEIQICTLPGFDNRWIIFYVKNSNTNGTGNYKFDEVYYSIFEITAWNSINFINGAKDIPLNPGKNYDYGKAMTKIYIEPNRQKVRYLYLRRDAKNYTDPNLSKSIYIEQFTINQNGIQVSGGGAPFIRSSMLINKNTDDTFLDVAIPIEINEKPNKVKSATIFYSQNGSKMVLITFLNHQNFGSGVTTEFIDFNKLAIIPSENTADNFSNYTVNNWQTIYRDFSYFTSFYLKNFSKKIAFLEFSPSGQYLYVSHGGFTHANESVITYLGQIDLNEKKGVGPQGSNGQFYPIRLKVQGVSGMDLNTNTVYRQTGQAKHWDNAYSQNFIEYNGLATIEKAANNKLYFTKANSNKLFCISNPDQEFNNIDLLPVDILANEPENVILLPSTLAPYDGLPTQFTQQADVFYLPDAIDQEEYAAYQNCPQDSIPCENCIGSFSPTKDKKYIISLWAKEDGVYGGKTTYNAPETYIEFPNSALAPIGPFKPNGPIIDGWQRVEGEFYLPPGANYSYFSIKLACLTGNCFFDDIRVFPFDGSMKTYVYDPITLRLSAELDERNYATFYEYDEEGKLVRVKKETERGIMMIQENKNSSVKKY